VLCVLVALAGPWTPARADDWPGPGDPFAGQGVVLADVALPSTGGVGVRVTLATAGEIDAVGWIDTGDPRSGNRAAADDMVAVGGVDWDVNAPATGPRGNSITTYTLGGPDVHVQKSGESVVDQRGSGGESWLDSGFGAGFPAGTYDVVIWAATNAPGATTRFRLHAPAGATLDNETVSSSAFLRAQRQFDGTAGATVDALPVTTSVPVLGNAPAVGASASVDQSASVSVSGSLFGVFLIPSGLLLAPFADSPVPFGRYTGPDGSHGVSGQAWLRGGSAGGYTFTLDKEAYLGTAGAEAFVTGTDITSP
jgi:hypothetical protein